MFTSLYKVNFNWLGFWGIAILIRIVFSDISWLSFFAIIISLHQFILLFNSIGSVIPIRYLFGTFMCLQIFIGPVLAYNGLDQYQSWDYKMRVSESEYFSYAIPAVLCFIAGLHIYCNKLEGEIIDQKAIKEIVLRNKNIPYIFLIVGFLGSLISDYLHFSSSLAFVFYLLGGFKFIGVYMIIIGDTKLKLIALFFVYASIVATSIALGLFHDLLTWLIFLGAIFAIHYKPSVKLKAVITFSFILLALTIQLLKGSYREVMRQGGEGVEAINRAYEISRGGNNFFSFQSLVNSSVRINQGFIITNIMITVPEKVPFANGEELSDILEAAFLPRILAPDKLIAGDKKIFTKYTGKDLTASTTMALSSLGDAYINFGIIGGCIFMFLLGLLYNRVLKTFYSIGKYYPLLLIFTPLVFYYPIRPDCELQTVLGHLVKSCFLLFVFFALWRRRFRAEGNSKIKLASA